MTNVFEMPEYDIGDTVKIVLDQIIGTNVITYSAWVPSALMGRHSTIRSFDQQYWGRVGTERLPPTIEALPPGSDERIAVVRAWHHILYAAAYKAIVDQYPEIPKNGRRDMGEIIIHG